LESRIVSLGQENKDLSEKVDLLLQEKMAMDIELSSMNTLLATRKSDMDRELKNREKLEILIKQTQQNLALKETEAQLKTEEAKHLKTNLSAIEIQLKQEKAMNQQLLNERDALNGRVARLSEEFEEQSLSITRLISETQAKAYEISVKDQDLKAALDEVKTSQRARDVLSKRIKALEEDKFEVQIERDKYKVHLSQLLST
jgi:chromosome segregation ATPase